MSIKKYEKKTLRVVSQKPAKNKVKIKLTKDSMYSCRELNSNNYPTAKLGSIDEIIDSINDAFYK